MSKQLDEFIENTLAHFQNANYIKPEEIPNIELYMDQVTTFMNSHLDGSKRFEEDKILTKTMINNYAKNNLLPPPVKKKYSKNHILMMIFIYYFKGFLSISDIQSIIKPLADHHFSEDASLSLADLYQQLFDQENQQLEILREDISTKYNLAKECFSDAEDSDFLQIFTMICLLSFDVYMKKQVIEKMIDTLLPSCQSNDPEKEKKPKKEKQNTAQSSE